MVFGVVGVIVGNVFIFALLLGVAFVCVEMMWYRAMGRKKQAGGKHIALITGASSGLGRMYAALVDEKCKGIDEIWLVARRTDKLKETAGLLAHTSKCLTIDLTCEEDLSRLKSSLGMSGVNVDILINCAGFGKIGNHQSLPARELADMISLNCTAVVNLTDICLPFMDKGSRIINVCSTAGFQPLHKLGVYSATKAFVLKYSRALRMELMKKKISVTAVCPYWIRDTEFISIAKGSDKGVKHFPFSSDVTTVGRLSLFGASIGLPVVTPGIICTIHRFFSKLLPDTILSYIWEGIRRV